jgi:hypothetical protein
LKSLNEQAERLQEIIVRREAWCFEHDWIMVPCTAAIVALRFVWHSSPSLWTYLLFFIPAWLWFSWVAFLLRRSVPPGRWLEPIIGGASNFAVTVANGGLMPAWIDSPSGVWTPINGDTNLVLLSDIFVFCSIGDILIFRWIWACYQVFKRESQQARYGGL